MNRLAYWRKGCRWILALCCSLWLARSEGAEIGIASIASGGESVRLSWDPNLEPQVVGYNLYYRSLNSGYEKVNVGGDTSVTLSGLERGMAYEFYVTAFTAENVESDPSSELRFKVGNRAPEADDLMVQGVEDSSLVFELSGRDEDGDALTVVTVKMPEHGQLSSLEEGVVYQPGKDFVGIDSYQYVVTDGYATSRVATVTFQVEGVNDLPVAGADFVSASGGAVKVISLGALIGNDWDAEGEGLAITAVSGSRFGGVVSLNGGEVHYTASEGYVGLDQFTYEVSDGQGGKSLGIVHVRVRREGEAEGGPGIECLLDGAMLVRFSGTAGMIYEVQGSEDLTRWEVLGDTTVSENGIGEFVDAEAVKCLSRYYRWKKK
ncbi:MAG: Ig-like domain-containing protein [Verrucomicrobiota bacterium]|nr:Ig-like domain-containing protein [Verrucomicrobiota bacterium]